jgi:hypothetical protein
MQLTEVCSGGAGWHLAYPKITDDLLGFPTERDKSEACRTDFSRYFRQLHNP